MRRIKANLARILDRFGVDTDALFAQAEVLALNSVIQLATLRLRTKYGAPVVAEPVPETPVASCCLGCGMVDCSCPKCRWCGMVDCKCPSEERPGE